jgi:hypothetical protein
MSTRQRRRRSPALEVLDTRLALNGFGGFAQAAVQVSMVPAASHVALNPQPLPPRIAYGGGGLDTNIADELNPQPLPPGGGPMLWF